MPVERLYIYRRGATNACALTGEKGDPRLPAPLAPDRWQFWMQTSRHPIEEGLHGFAMETAVTQIDARGYYLFTGSAQLLATRVVARAATPKVSIIATSTDASSSPQ
jgi:hypothetical protein